ncbi:hypothetical protein MMC08_008395, partial [Hypocenomyce scalaris]|nr:hypothetical protein [Hypocenomyce scalaris]
MTLIFTNFSYLLDIPYNYILGRPMNVATGMGSSGPKQTASKTGRGGKRGTVKGHSRRTITKVQAPLKKGGKQAKAAKRNPQRDAVESAFQESDQRPYKDLAESKLFQGIETADDDATTQLLSQIYADLHEASFDALTTHTKDFTLASAGVPDSADTYLSSRLKYSVQSRLILHTQEMFSVIDDAYTSGADRPMIVFNAVNSIRNGPDHHRRVE